MWTLEVHGGLRYKGRSMFPSPVEVFHLRWRFTIPRPGFSVSRFLGFSSLPATKPGRLDVPASMRWSQAADDETTGHLRITSPSPSLDPRGHMLPVHRRPRCRKPRVFKPMTV